ncbi:MAG: release factor glutamine methyltransferase [Thermoleophilaceae bacterium]|nr:release factor glutamine methyltransferase [Thermoleophilaceae bacterium]
MRLIRLPGVFAPRSDTWMLAREAVTSLKGDDEALELCTGSGAVALEMAAAGARVTAVDVSRRSIATVRLNARVRGLRVRALRGSLFEPVGDKTFDLIVTNPPYLPAPDADLPQRGPERAWDAGLDGRALIDPICDAARAHLKPGGAILIIHSSLSGTELTGERLAATGLDVDVPFRHRGPLGPLMLARVEHLEAIGALDDGQREEEVVIVRGRRA